MTLIVRARLIIRALPLRPMFTTVGATLLRVTITSFIGQ